jgi:hypothetical protein
MALSDDILLVRTYLNDLDSAHYELTDVQITAFLAIYPNPLKAAAYAALSVSAKYGRYSSRSIDGLSISYGSISNVYQELFKTLLAESEKNSDAGIYVGGLSTTERDSDDADPNLSGSASFRIDQFKNPRI